MKRFFFFAFILLLRLPAFSQEADTIVSPADSVVVDEYIEDEEAGDAYAGPDTTSVTAREFDGTTLNKLKDDTELQYKEIPTVAESLWDRFKMWIAQLIEAFFNGAVNTNWGRVIVYIVSLVVIVIVIMMLLKIDAFKVFFSGEGAKTFKHDVLDEDIHAMDFDKLIQEAASRNDYRAGVRLIFLYALKMLSDKNMIHWDQGKTNHDYIDELKVAELKSGFHDLNYYFEYAWYGNFNINQQMFSQVQGIFNEWKGRLR